jgi:hypothetical protein
MLRRLLLAAGGGGSFTDMGYSMSAEEVTFWQDMAALLDPDAYEWVITSGTPASRTVPSDEHWYLVSGWKLYTLGGTTPLWFHRQVDVRVQPLVLPADTVISTSNVSGSSMYLCKPSLVTGGDSRYASDPRALYFERLALLGTLPQFQVGGTQTDNGISTAAFAGGFTDGLIVHASQHDVAWIAMFDTGAAGAGLLLNEISDTDRNRFAETVLMPFKTTTWDSVEWRGATQSEGQTNVNYVKLDGSGW